MSFVEAIIDSMKSAISSIGNIFTSNMYNAALLIEYILPIAMFIVGSFRGSEDMLINIVLCILAVTIVKAFTYFIKQVANRMGKGSTVPIPSKRFTQVDADGEVSIPTERVQELILYVGDLEDWFEKHGMIK